jgi:imidazolonepropionase
MSALLLTNIKQLVNVREQWPVLRGKDLAELPCIDNAYLLIEDDTIVAYGTMDELAAASHAKPANVIDATGKLVMPTWCDSHTHIVFAASRENEFIDKLKGLSYAEIAARGGGILNSARKLNDASEDELFNMAWERLTALSKLGTGAIEIKSGYGLTVEGELKMLRVIKKLRERSAVTIKATFLGAHTYPVEYKDNHQAYIDLIIQEMLPVIGREKLADYIDVFCETGFFSQAETETICKAGMQYGLKPKIHANQLNLSASGNMNLVVNMSCIQMKMLPEEAINAATLNGAWAMECANELGSISVGKKANLIITQPVPSLAYLPYSFGSNLIERVMIKGEWV